MDDERLREKIEVLDGSRRRGPKTRAAVRIADLAPLLQIPQLQATPAAGAAPTAAEYAALLRDVERVHARLTEVATLLQAHLL
jgi:hypothetical protein